MQRRSEREKWWDAQDRRNFGETLPEEEEVLSVWAPDITPQHISPRGALGQQGIFVVCVALFAGLVYAVGWRRPGVSEREAGKCGRQHLAKHFFLESYQVAREYPYDGLLRELSGTQSDEYKHLSARGVGQGQADIEAAKKAAQEAAEAEEEE